MTAPVPCYIFRGGDHQGPPLRTILKYISEHRSTRLLSIYVYMDIIRYDVPLYVPLGCMYAPERIAPTSERRVLCSGSGGLSEVRSPAPTPFCRLCCRAVSGITPCLIQIKWSFCDAPCPVCLVSS